MDEAAVRDFFRAAGEGEIEAVTERLSEDCVLQFPGERFGGRFEGRRRVGVFFKSNRRLFRDGSSFEIEWLGLTEGRAVVQWTNRGTTRDGSDYSNRGVTILRFDEEGRACEIQDYLDTERLSRTWPRSSDLA